MEIKVRSKRKENRYYLDNEFLNGYAAKVGWQGHIVYSALCRHERNGKAFPGMRHLAKELGVSINSVQKGIKALKHWNIIQIEKPPKKNYPQTYWLLDYSKWRNIEEKEGWHNRPVSQQRQGVSPQEQGVSPQEQGVSVVIQNNTKLTTPSNNNKQVSSLRSTDSASSKAQPPSAAELNNQESPAKDSEKPIQTLEKLSQPEEPRIVQRIIEFYSSLFEEIFHDPPEIDSSDIKMIERRLAEGYSEEDLTDLIDWFLESKVSGKLNPRLRVALCEKVIQQWNEVKRERMYD